MAGIHAIHVTCEAVVRLLGELYRPDLIERELNLQFAVYTTEDFKGPMAAGLSLYLYRLHVNDSQRSPFGNSTTDYPQLPLDLHFFLTAWGKQASLQHAILGWALRALEDHRTLPAALLNGVRPEAPVFGDNETVEVVDGQLSNEELMRIWDGLGVEYRLSVPFVARVVRIDSMLPTKTTGIVRQRQFGYGELKKE